MLEVYKTTYQIIRLVLDYLQYTGKCVDYHKLLRILPSGNIATGRSVRDYLEDLSEAGAISFKYGIIRPRHTPHNFGHLKDLLKRRIYFDTLDDIISSDTKVIRELEDKGYIKTIVHDRNLRIYKVIDRTGAISMLDKLDEEIRKNEAKLIKDFLKTKYNIDIEELVTTKYCSF